MARAHRILEMMAHGDMTLGQMNYQDRILYSMQYLHGTKDSARKATSSNGFDPRFFTDKVKELLLNCPKDIVKLLEKCYITINNLNQLRGFVDEILKKMTRNVISSLTGWN